MTLPDLNLYYQKMGFKEAPFRLTPDTNFFFPGSHHLEALHHLKFGIASGGLTLLTGEVGLGKTLLCRHLLRHPLPGVRFAYLLNPDQSYEDLLVSIVEDVTGQLPVNRALGALQRELQKLLLQLAEAGIRVVVLVDEAHRLSGKVLEGLRLLSNLDTEKDKLLCLLLVGQPELEQRLAAWIFRPLRQRISVHYRLEPFTYWETRAYILHRPARISHQENIRLAGLKICGVDDHPTNRHLLAQYFQDWHMNGCLAATPTEALKLFRHAAKQHKPFDLAILDMEMPEMDGLALAQTIKGDSTIASVRLVLLTSLGRRGDAKAAQDAGFIGYLTKPIRKGHLQACLETVMGYEPRTSPAGPRPFITDHHLQEWRRQKAARILIADDHHVNQQLAVMLVERLGYRADVVANGQEAVEALSRIPYDAVLMDCHMPQLDGYAATRTIRQWEGPPGHTPIIAMTANAILGDREKCLDAGMDDYLSKPLRPEALALVLAKWVHPAVEARPPDGPLGPPASLSPPVALTAPATPMHTLNRHILDQWQEIGGKAFVEKMVQKFVEEATACVMVIEQAMEAEDLAQLQETAHGLKGIARNMGTDVLAHLAMQIETLCKDGNLAALADRTPQLQGTFQQALREFEKGQEIR